MKVWQGFLHAVFMDLLSNDQVYVLFPAALWIVHRFIIILKKTTKGIKGRFWQEQTPDQAVKTGIA